MLARVLPAWTDAWAQLHPQDPGHTFDGARNPHVRRRVLLRMFDTQDAHSIDEIRPFDALSSRNILIYLA